MIDVLAALEQMSVMLTQLGATVDGGRGKFVAPHRVRALTTALAQHYYDSIRNEVESAQERPTLTADVDVAVNGLFCLSTAPRRKTAYKTQLAALRSHLDTAAIDVMRARG